MTKKSIGRVARDEAKKQLDQELKDNKQWDELNALYMQAKAFIAAHANLNAVLDNKDIIRLVKDKPTLISNIRLITKDLSQHNSELEMIYSIHKDRYGKCEVEDIMLYFEIFEKYSQFMTQIEAVVSPTFHHICEQTREAEQLLKQEQEQQKALQIAEGENTEGTVLQAAQDINSRSIIDIDFKESTKEH